MLDVFCAYEGLLLEVVVILSETKDLGLG